MDKVTLDNGLRIIFDENNSLQSACLSVWVASGSRFETERSNGISHFIEHMVFKGTEHLSAFEIARHADEIGGQLNAYTTKEYTCFYVKSLGKHIGKAADILFDMLRCPLFAQKDLDVERGVVLEEIAMCEDDPSDVCFGLLERTMMPNNSLGREILGTAENVKSFTPDDLRDHMKRYYVPQRIVIGISGCFERNMMLEKINDCFGSMEQTDYSVYFEQVEQKADFAVVKRHFEQSQLMIAFPCVGSERKERFSLQVLLSILGSSSSSRLNQRIREQLGLVYSVDSWLSQSVGTGFLGVSLALTPASEKKALYETCMILHDFADTITESELEVAKEKVKSNLLMSREMPHSRLAANGYAQITRNAFTSDEEIINVINGLTISDAKILANKFIDPYKICFAAAGRVRKASFYSDIVNKAFGMI